MKIAISSERCKALGEVKAGSIILYSPAGKTNILYALSHFEKEEEYDKVTATCPIISDLSNIIGIKSNIEFGNECVVFNLISNNLMILNKSTEVEILTPLEVDKESGCITLQK